MTLCTALKAGQNGVQGVFCHTIKTRQSLAVCAQRAGLEELY